MKCGQIGLLHILLDRRVALIFFFLNFNYSVMLCYIICKMADVANSQMYQSAKQIDERSDYVDAWLEDA